VGRLIKKAAKTFERLEIADDSITLGTGSCDLISGGSDKVTGEHPQSWTGVRGVNRDRLPSA